MERVDRLSPGGSALIVFVVLLALYVPTSTMDFRINVDTAMTALPAWNLVENGTLDLSEHRDFLAGRAHTMDESREVGDALYSGRNIGAIAWAVPFYAVASPWTGPDPFPVWPAALAAAVAAAGAMALLHLTFRELLRPPHAVVAAVVAGTATTTWSVSADALWTHGPAQLFLCGAMLLLARSRAAAAGGAFGVALVTRPYTAFAAATTGLYLSIRQRALTPALRLGLTSLLGVVSLLVYTRVVFDRWSILGGYYVFSDAYASNVTGVTGGNASLLGRLGFHLSRFGRALADPDQGLLVYSPFLVLLLPGLFRAWRAAPDWVRALALAGIAQFVAQLLVNGWYGGEFFFGYRYTLEALTLWAPLLALAWREYVLPDRGRTRLVGLLLAFNVAWIGYGAVLEPYKG